jgi:protocatechuate 3,4-dioxygenase beta subunit
LFVAEEEESMRLLVKYVVLASVLCALMSLAPRTAQAKPIRITGSVVDYRAQAVEGAAIIVYSQSTEASFAGGPLTKLGEVKSSADGRFDIAIERDEKIFPDALWLIAYKAGLAMCWTTRDLGTRPAVLCLGRVRPLGGIVVDEAGRPVAGAKVKLCVKDELMEFGEFPLPGPEDWHVRRTDKDGRFLFDSLPADATADFQLEAPGQARFWTFRDFGPREGEQFPAGRTDIRLTLHPEARLEGTVVDEDTGRPVSAVRVLARPHQRVGTKYGYGPAKVDPNGRFVLTGLAAGAYLLDVVAPEGQSQDWFSAGPLVTVRPGQTTRDFQLAVNPGATLEVVMREADSETGVEGLQVHVSCDRYRCTRATDVNGVVRLHVPAGKCFISGYKDGYGGSPDHEVQLEKGQVQREEMRLYAWAVRVSGTVMDPNGHALADSAVGHWAAWHIPPTDAQGQFEYTYYSSGPASAHTMFARHEPSGLANIVELKNTSEDRQLSGQIVLKAAYTLVGRVTDPNGAAIPAAAVRLVVGSHRHNPNRILTLTQTTTDANGVYHLRAIPQPSEDYYYAVATHAPGYSEASVDPVPLPERVDESVRLPALTLQPADQVVAGTVVDTNDKPVAGAMVESSRLQRAWYQEHEDVLQPHRAAFTDAQGRFRLEGLCKGPVEVTASAAMAGHQEGVTYTSAGEKSVKIMLGQTLSFARSLTSSRLPSLADFGLREQLPGLEGKGVLLCFLDVQQRPSRHMLSQLVEHARELTKSNIALVAVQVAPCEAGELGKLAAQYGADIRFGEVTDNAGDAQRAWGIQSLPWLVLADRDHIVRAEGFAPAALQQKVDELAAGPVPR